MCGLCSRLRRGALYRYAAENGMTKIALGHHRDDIVETLFLNMFFGGRLKAMPPKLLSEDGRHIVIRPLALRARRARSRAMPPPARFPIIPCTLCGSQPNMQRLAVKNMLARVGAAISRPHRIDFLEHVQRGGFAARGPGTVRFRAASKAAATAPQCQCAPDRIQILANTQAIAAPASHPDLQPST